MKKYAIVLCVLLIALVSLGACQPEQNSKWDPDSANPFDFDGNMVRPEAVIDGYDNDELWQSPNKVTVEYADTVVSIVRKPNAIYLFFKVRDNTPFRYVGSGAAEEVTHSDSVEFYFDAKLSRTAAPSAGDYQINLGRDSRTRICAGAGWIKWMAMYMFEVREGSVMDNDEEYYYVEAMLPLAQMGIGANDAIGMAFGQVDRSVDVNNDLPGYFTWRGLTFEGGFADPQKPNTYVVLTADGNKLLTYQQYLDTLQTK